VSGTVKSGPQLAWVVEISQAFSTESVSCEDLSNLVHNSVNSGEKSNKHCKWVYISNCLQLRESREIRRQEIKTEIISGWLRSTGDHRWAWSVDPEESVDLNESVDLDESFGSEQVLWIWTSLVDLNESVDFYGKLPDCLPGDSDWGLPLCFFSVIQTEVKSVVTDRADVM